MALIPTSRIASLGSVRWWPEVAAWGLLLAATLTLVVSLDTGHPHREDLFHPEAIYPLALALDLDASAHWATPYAPYYLPDLALYLWIAGRIEPAEAAVYGFGVAQFLLFVLGARWSLGAVPVDAEARRRVWLGVVFACVFFPLAVMLGLDPSGRWLQLFVGAFHTGALIWWIWSLGILLRWQRAKREPADSELGGRKHGARRWSILLLAAVALGVASDRLLLVLLVAPAALVWGFAPKRPFVRPDLLGSLGLGAILGMWLPGLWTTIGGPAVPALVFPGSEAFFDRCSTLWQREDTLSFAVDRFFERWGAWYRLTWMVWLGWTVFGALRQPESGLRTLHRFALSTCLCGLLGAALIGLGVYGAHSGSPAILLMSRYLLALHVLPLLTPVVALATVASPGLRQQVGSVAFVVGGGALGWVWSGLELPRSFPAYRPAEVVCLDRLAAEHELETGLMYFFAAQRVRVFSRMGLQIDTVDEHFRPFTWIGDRRQRGAESGYDFVILDRLRDPRAVAEALGSPDRTVHCGGSTVWLYDTPRHPDW